MPNQQSLSIGQAAKYLGISLDTLRRWEKKGKIKATRLDGKNRSFLISDLEKLKYGDTLTVKQAANRLKMSPSSLRRLSDDGKIASTTDSNGYRKYQIPALENFASIDKTITGKAIIDEPVHGVDPELQPLPRTFLVNIENSLTRVRKGWKFTFLILLLIIAFSLVSFAAITSSFLTDSKKAAKFFNFKYQQDRNVLGVSTVTGALLQGTAETSVKLLRVVNPESVEGVILPGEEPLVISSPSLKEITTVGEGIEGERGPQGLRGLTGLTGSTGSAGGAGAKGDTGATGETGATGAAGADGSFSGSYSSADGLQLTPYGTSSGNTTSLLLYELLANGTDYVGFKAPDSISTSITWTLPDSDGSPSECLKTDGLGSLSFGTCGGGGGGGVTSLNTETGDLTIAGGGINSISAVGTTITVTATEADTLAAVTGRGATTATALTLSSNSNLITAGTLTVNSESFTDLTGNGLSISSGALTLASTTAGGGLTYSSGVLAVGGGSGITVNADDISIDTSVVVTLTGVQTLTNKTLTTPTIATILNGGTLTLPTSTDTLIGRATTDTLTNKTIDAGSNTITGLTNSNLSGSAGITNANLANSSITFAGDTGSSATSLGGTRTIAGTAAQGISTSESGGTVTVTAANATASQKGVASFSSSFFTVSSGAVSIAANSLDFSEFQDTLDLDAALTLNQGTNTWTQNYTGTTSNGFTYNANSLTSGKALSLSSTSTGMTSGGLASFDWSPGLATNATGDLFSLSIGANGSTSGYLFTIKDSGASVLGVSETQFSTSLPANFTAPGDVSFAYDVTFTNPTAAYIKSYSALTIQPGDPFASSNLTFQTYNQGSVVFSTANTTSTALDFTNSTLTSGIGMNIALTGTAQTSASALNITQSGTSTGFTGNLVNITGSSTTGAGNALGITSVNTTAGSALALTSNALTTGDAALISSTSTGLTTGSLLKISSATTGAVATDGIVNLTATGAYTSTSNVGLLNLVANATLTGTIENISGNVLTSGRALNITSSSTGLLSTGALQEITLSGSNAANAGPLLLLTNSGTANTNTTFMIQHNATGTNNLAFRVNDEASDTTPFIIDGGGNVGIGTTAPLDILTLSQAVPGSDVTVRVQNTSTAVGSNEASLLVIADGQNNEGDVYTRYVSKNGGASEKQWITGIDTSNTGAFGIHPESMTSTGLTIEYATGSVGIGDSSPDALLDLDSSTATTAMFGITNTGAFTGTGTSSVASIVANSASSGDVLTLSSTGLTTGQALTINGAQTGNVGRAAGLVDINLTYSPAAGGESAGITTAITNSPTLTSNVSFGTTTRIDDATALNNIDIGVYSVVVDAGSSNKTLYGYLTDMSSSSTIANNLYGVQSSPIKTGNVQSGTQENYGYRSAPSSTGPSTGTTAVTNVFGFYTGITATHAADAGTIAGYGLYVANGTMTTNGASSQHGVYVSGMAGADSNYGLRIGNMTGNQTSNFGIYIEGVSGASTNNYSIFSSSGTNYLGGNLSVGSGNVSAERTLDVDGTARITQSVSVTDDRTLCTAAASGDIELVNGACGTSSRRYKENIKELSYGLDDLMKLNPVFFNYIKDSKAPSDSSIIENRTKRRIGFIAEEVNEVVPEIVQWQDGRVEGLDLSYMTALNTKAIQELNRKVEDALLALDKEGQVKNSAKINEAEQASDSSRLKELSTQDNFLVKGILTVLETISTSRLVVTEWAEFLADAVFKGSVSFLGKVDFNQDTAGTAVIKKGADQVRITFENAYEETPIINAGMTLDQALSDEEKALLDHVLLEEKEASQSALEQRILNGEVKFLVTNRSKEGFIIKLNKPIEDDITFSWTALLVKNAKKFESEGEALTQAVPQVEKVADTAPEVLSAATPSAALVSTVELVKTKEEATASAEIAEVAKEAQPETTVKINSNSLGFLRVRESASTSSEELSQVDPGEVFNVIDQQKASNGIIWYKILLSDNSQGWVSGSYVTVRET